MVSGTDEMAIVWGESARTSLCGHVQRTGSGGGWVSRDPGPTFAGFEADEQSGMRLSGMRLVAIKTGDGCLRQPKPKLRKCVHGRECVRLLAVKLFVINVLLIISVYVNFLGLWIQ
jgi:hypothetical protein